MLSIRLIENAHICRKIKTRGKQTCFQSSYDTAICQGRRKHYKVGHLGTVSRRVIEHIVWG